MYNWFEKQFAKHRRKMQTGEGGFTLVELLVVIAILGILGGVSVPVYTGYTKRANEAADQQIVAAANSAFASACLENSIDAKDVQEASISVREEKVYGLSTFKYDNDESYIGKLAPAFDKYFAESKEMIFKTEGTKSLVWNDLLDCFEMKNVAAALRIVLPGGKAILISPEDIDAITGSSFDGMGVSRVTTALNNINASGEVLATLAATAGKLDSLTNIMINNGYIDANEAAKLKADLSLSNLAPDWLGGSAAKREAYAAAQQKSANGLQMCVAEYISSASDTQVNELMNYNLGNNTSGLVSAFTQTGGSFGSSALAMQYGVVSGFANSDEYGETTITVGRKQMTISEYLASSDAKDDPVKAIATIKGTSAYQEYQATEQYNKDVNALAATLSAVGSNLDTIGTDEYLKDGANCTNSQAVLGTLLGK